MSLVKTGWRGEGDEGIMEMTFRGLKGVSATEAGTGAMGVNASQVDYR
jgi:hypothetical protein